MSSKRIDILIPTYNRPDALAVTLTSLAAQTMSDFRVVVSDQSESENVAEVGVVKAIRRVLKVHGNEVEIYKHLPRKGMAEQRQFLLEQVQAPYALYLDDDLILEPFVLHNMLQAIASEDCGFVGSALIGLSYQEDIRLDEQKIEFWEGPVQAETIQPGSPARERYRLHNAAKLRSVGGFDFWRDLPVEHCGEDVLAQMRVMASYGGFGLIPSGVYHQELPTTIPNRQVDAPHVLDLFPADFESLHEQTERV